MKFYCPPLKDFYFEDQLLSKTFHIEFNLNNLHKVVLQFCHFGTCIVAIYIVNKLQGLTD